jgi:hypothetical protein
MGNLYVRSSDGADTDNGSTWALAKATLVGAGAIDAAGDVIYLSSAHAESTTSAQTFACAGTPGNVSRVLSANDTAEPPTAGANGASITCTAAYTLNGSFYMQGVTFTCLSMSLGNSSATIQHFKDCTFRITAAGTSGVFQQNGLATSMNTILENPTFKFANSANRIGTAHRMTIKGGQFDGAGSTPASIFALGLASPGRGGHVEISGMDFSALAASVNIVDASQTTSSSKFIMRDCKLPASWSGLLVSSISSLPSPGVRIEMHNCDSGDTNYRLDIVDYAGEIKSETTNVRSGGASDGTTALSWKMVSSANASYPSVPLESGEIAVWNDVTGGSGIQIDVEILHDSLTSLTNAEAWLIALGVTTSGVPLGSNVSSIKSDTFAAAANISNSSATWTTTGLTNPKAQKLSVTMTPTKKGWIVLKVALAKASKTIFVCPKPTVTAL